MIAGSEGGALLEDRVEVPVVLGQMEDALAALSVEGLDDHLPAEFRHERLQLAIRRVTRVGA